MPGKKIILIFSIVILNTLAKSQIIVTNTQTPAVLIDSVLIGNGIMATNITFNYSAQMGDSVMVQVGYFNANSTAFPISEGMIIATGNVAIAVGPNNSTMASDNIGLAPDPNDPDLDAISTAVLNNEAILEFDFIPTGDSLVFRYVFASEEYPENSPGTFNDCFGFFISGPGIAGPYTNGAVNMAQLPSSLGPVTINNVNPTTNPGYYFDNTGDTAIQFDGRTIVLTASASVQCGATYHIKIGIADASDQSYDSAVFLEANSFSSSALYVPLAYVSGSAFISETADSALITFTRPAGDVATSLDVNYTVGGTATNGVDYPLLPGLINFPIGVDTVQFYIVPYIDAIEGTETIIISVNIINSCGDSINSEAVVAIGNLSVEENSDELNPFSLFPTINNGTIFVKNNLEFHNCQLLIYDVSGKIIMREKLISNNSEFQIEQKSGTFIYKIFDEKSEIIQSGKIIIIND